MSSEVLFGMSTKPFSATFEPPGHLHEFVNLRLLEPTSRRGANERKPAAATVHGCHSLLEGSNASVSDIGQTGCEGCFYLYMIGLWPGSSWVNCQPPRRLTAEMLTHTG